jgi:hypothetical protein
MSNKSEPVAWIQNAADAIDSALLCSGNNCESLLKENLERDYPRRRKIIIDIISGYAGRAAPALTAELRDELTKIIPRASWMLDCYSDFLKSTMPSDMDRHPYLPEIEQISGDLLAAITKLTNTG